MAAEAMISEGGALRQPSQEQSEAALAQVRENPVYRPLPWQSLSYPAVMFLAGLATGLLISLLAHRQK
jgi:hypothetical protein